MPESSDTFVERMCSGLHTSLSPFGLTRVLKFNGQLVCDALQHELLFCGAEHLPRQQNVDVISKMCTAAAVQLVLTPGEGVPTVTVPR